MPRKTDGEKIDELEKVIATFTERLDNVRQELKQGGTALTDAANAIADLKTGLALVKRDMENLLKWEHGDPKTVFALLRKEVEGLQKWRDELKKEKEEHSRRIWAFGPNIMGAIVNVLLSAIVSGIVAYFATR